MSHVSTIIFEEVWELDTLKDMCTAEGWTWLEGKKTYEWFGRHVGDYPIPEGFTLQEIGHCNHAIKIPNAQYEIGVVIKDKKISLLWDFWRSGGLQKALGENAGKLKQAYTMAKVRRACRKGRVRRRFQETTKQGYREIEISMG
jgi:hypothetical protein